MEPYILLLIIPAFCVLFLIVWMSVVFLTSRISGWGSLAKQYPGADQPEGPFFNWHSARFGLMGAYNHCLKIGVSRQGIFLQPAIPFRVGHDPILIPWDALDGFKLGRTLFWPYAKIAIARKSGGRPYTITLFGQALCKELERQFHLK